MRERASTGQVPGKCHKTIRELAFEARACEARACEVRQCSRSPQRGHAKRGHASAGTHAHYSTIHTLMLPAEENPCLAIHAWGKYKTRGEAGKYHKTIRELAFEVRACEVRAHAITARQGGRPQ